MESMTLVSLTPDQRPPRGIEQGATPYVHYLARRPFHHVHQCLHRRAREPATTARLARHGHRARHATAVRLCLRPSAPEPGWYTRRTLCTVEKSGGVRGDVAQSRRAAPHGRGGTGPGDSERGAGSRVATRHPRDDGRWRGGI